METYFEKQARELYEKVNKLVDVYALLKRTDNEVKLDIEIPKDFYKEFFSLIDKVNMSLMEEKDNFYGYFLFQMGREIRLDISTPTAINFKNAKYVIYFNPIIFLNLTISQMESTIKHEILHVISLHLIRAEDLKKKYSKLAINIAMDVVVNSYLINLPPYATTVQWVNLNYSLDLKPFESFEYYVENIQTALDLLEENEEEKEHNNKNVEREYSAERTHDIWEESNSIDEKTLREFTEKAIDSSQRGIVPTYLDSIIVALKNSKGELPWNLYLKRLMGTVESNKKKTITRRSRRQPDRLDLRGELRDHKAEIAVAIDISGSISDEEFKQAMKEVINIVKNYNHKITIIECDDEIRRTYKVKSIKDVRERMNIRGATKFSPVFKYANNKKFNLLIYFTDGKGESRVEVVPRGYKILWIISGSGDKLSLEEPYGAVKKFGKIKAREEGLNIRDMIDDGYSMNNQAPII